MQSFEKIPLIHIYGSAKEKGFQYGSSCKDRIKKNIEIYEKMFDLDELQIRKLADHYKEQIEAFNPNYIIEMDAIAESAEIEPYWIYALNSRTEILNRVVNECTSVYFEHSGLLGQNWDWVEESEDLIVLLKMTLENGMEILTLTEPGIIGKIGFNNHGLGVCLNYLYVDKENSLGIPVHILLRSILESRTIEEALRHIDPYDKGTASNILIGDQHGNYLDLELAIEKTFFFPSEHPIFIHTNHYLAGGFDNSLDNFAGSITRFNKASDIAKCLSGSSKAEMKIILLDDSDNELPICKKYTYTEGLGNVGTVSTILIDFKNLTMELSDGNPLENNFFIVSLSDFQKNN